MQTNLLDEAPEFGPTVLNTLRQPLEDGWVTLARAGGTTRYPARVLLVLAANPCPCGAPADSACTCSSIIRRRYLGRLSGPLMDRVDLQVQLVPVTATDLLGTTTQVETSAEVLARVLAARAIAAARWASHGFETNAQAPGRLLRAEPFRLSSAATEKLTKYLNNGTLSARGFDRVLRVAWTIADLDGRAQPTEAEVGEAFELRTGGKP